MRPQAKGRVEPMLAVMAPGLPADAESYAYEFKWDGIRALAYVEGDEVRLQSRSGRDVTRQYPELREVTTRLRGRNAVLDGEIVAFDAEGRPSFGELQKRMNLESALGIKRAMKTTPVCFYAFDVLAVDGHWLVEAPYETRRATLDDLRLQDTVCRTPSSFVGIGREALEASRLAGLEGVVAKRLGSPYLPGRRSPAWLKIKNKHEQEFVIGGLTRGEGSRDGELGALLTGYYDEEGRLSYAGKVGTGFDAPTLRDLRKRLQPLKRATSPFEVGSPPAGSQFVEPILVAQVEFAEWTHLGTLRQPSFKGLRSDKDPKSVVKEENTMMER